MAACSTVELHHFFSMEKETSFSKPPMKLLDRKRSFRDIQGVISKINPEVVKAVIASGSANAVSMENCDVICPNIVGKKHQIPSFLCNPMNRSCADHQTGAETAPMTIFYKGAVVVYDVPHQQAKNILEVAEKATESNPDIKTNDNSIFVQSEGMPLTRKKSLRRFLEKRKERQINTGLSWDGILRDTALPSQNASDDNEVKKDEA